MLVVSVKLFHSCFYRMYAGSSGGRRGNLEVDSHDSLCSYLLSFPPSFTTLSLFLPPSPLPPSLPPSFATLLDMGNGQPDDSIQVDAGQQPALNTTRLVLNQINETDLVLHIGDISYARGYAGVVRSLQKSQLYSLNCFLSDNLEETAYI